jgi:hypothetical protein
MKSKQGSGRENLIEEMSLELRAKGRVVKRRENHQSRGENSHKGPWGQRACRAERLDSAPRT